MAKKKEKRTNFLDFSLCKRKRDFLLLTKGKAPLTFFFSSLCAAAAARLGGARSAAFLLPLPATNEASQPAPIRANFFPVRLEPAGRRGVVPPSQCCSARPRAGRSPGVRRGQLSGFRSNFHPPCGGRRGEAGSGARRGRLRGLGQAGGGSAGAHFLRHISDI